MSFDKVCEEEIKQIECKQIFWNEQKRIITKLLNLYNEINIELENEIKIINNLSSIIC